MPYFVSGNGKQEGPDRLDNYYSIKSLFKFISEKVIMLLLALKN